MIDTKPADNKDTRPMSLWRYIKCCWGYGLKPSDLPLQRRFLLMTFGWAVTYVLATKAIVADWVSGPLVWLVAGLPLILACLALHAYLKLLSRMDELMRQVQLDGIAIGFGLSLIVVVGYVLFERLGAPALGTNGVITILAVGWAIGQLVAIRRFS